MVTSDPAPLETGGVDTVQWALYSPVTGYFQCRDEKHAQAMMRSTSVALGPRETRKLAWRRVTPWTVAERDGGPT